MRDNEPEMTKHDIAEHERRKRWRWHCEDVEDERKGIDNTLTGVTDEEIAKHRDAVIQANPILAWIQTIPLSTQIVRVFVADRIDHNLRYDFDHGLVHHRNNSVELVEIDLSARIDDGKLPNELFTSQIPS